MVLGAARLETDLQVTATSGSVFIVRDVTFSIRRNLFVLSSVILVA